MKQINVDTPSTANVRNDEMPALSLCTVHNEDECYQCYRLLQHITVRPISS